MNRKIVIKDCDHCPHREHSGAFTRGGEYPLCCATYSQRINQDQAPDYRGPMAVLPFKIQDNGRGRACRAYTGEIPNWCPLPEDNQ